MRDFGGMVSFLLRGGEEAALKVVERTELFTLAESLGAVEWLIEHPGRMTHASVAGSPLEVPASLVRLWVGLETPPTSWPTSSRPSTASPEPTPAAASSRGVEQRRLAGPVDPHARPRHVVVHEHPRPAVDGARAVALERGLVDRAGIALVGVERPVRVVSACSRITRSRVTLARIDAAATGRQ